MHDISFTVSNLAPRQIIMSFQVQSRSVSSAWDTVQVIVTMLILGTFSDYCVSIDVVHVHYLSYVVLC